MRNFIQIAVIMCLSVLLLNQCNITAQKESSYQNNIEASLDSIKYYKNILGQEVAEKLAYKGSKNDLEQFLNAEKEKNKQLAASLKKWKTIASATKTTTVTEIKEVPVPFEVKIPCNFERTFLKEDPFYTFSGIVNQDGITFKNLLIPNTQTLVIGKKKTGFFKTEFRVESTNSNPYIKTTSLDNFTFIEKQKRFGIGVSFGFGFYQKGFFIGPSINYNFMQF